MRNCLIILSLLFTQTIVAQQDTASMGSDDLFKIARNLAFEGNRQSAQKYLKLILQKSPDYTDVAVFLARTYAWDGDRQEARKLLVAILQKEPKNTDALLAITDTELWDDKPQAALEYANSALKLAPNNEDLLLRKARAQYDLNQKTEAAQSISALLSINQSNKEAIELRNKLANEQIKNSITANYQVDVFDRTFTPAHYSSLQYGRRTARGSLFIRGNYNTRFGEKGQQGEVDYYPTLFKGVYAYLNYGYSSTSLFPLHRMGAELYFKLPKSFEGSLGFRYLYFDKSSKVTLYTATIGKYYKSYWFSARTFITPGGAGTANSYIFQIRRYFNTFENYLGIIGGFGFSPDQRIFVSADQAAVSPIYKLKSQRIGLDYQRTFGIHWLASAQINLGLQEYLFDLGNPIGFYNLNFSLQYRF